MQEKAQLYLHIGHAKAGSTTLQHFLFKNWEYLDAEGYALPTAEIQIASATAPPGNPIVTLQAMREAKNIERLKRWIIDASKTKNRLIFSSECLTDWVWHPLFKELTDFVDINLIYYVRRQDEYILSAWRQWGLKKGMPLDDFIEKHLLEGRPDYWSILAPWRNRVGIKSLHTRFIGKDFLAGGNIQHDFAAHLGLDITKMSMFENQNRSMDARLLLFMNKRSEMFSSIHDDTIFNLLSDKAPSATPMRLTLTKSQFRRAQEAFEEKNQDYLREFHPRCFGTPVLEEKTALIGTEANAISEEVQAEYVKARLKALAHSSDHRITALKVELLSAK